MQDTDFDNRPAPFFFSCRFMLAVIGFFVFLHLYAQRIGMSVAIVCMLNQTALDELETLQTVNDTELARHNSDASEWSLNATMRSSAKSQCQHRRDDGTVFHQVDICLCW